MNTRRLLTFLVFVAPLLILITAGVFMVRRYYRTAEQNLAPILQAELTRVLKREVRVGGVTIEGLNVFVDDVHVAEKRTFAEGGEMARARRIRLDFDLRRILLSDDKTIPYFAGVEVFDPVARITRDRRGRFNFEDLIQRPQEPRGRPTVGTVTVRNGTVSFRDEAFPHHAKRRVGPFVTVLRNLDGRLDLHADRSATFLASASGPAGQVRAFDLLGDYDPAAKRLFVKTNASGIHLPALNRFLPPDTRIAAGTGNAQVTLLRTPAAGSAFTNTYEADVAVADATVHSARVREPVRGIRGQATIANDTATLKLDAGFAGSRLHAEGTVLGFRRPIVKGWATGSGVQLQRILAATGTQDRVPALRGLRVTADVRAEVAGPLERPAITASGPVAITGPLPGGARLGREGTLQLSFSGSLEAPAVTARGTLPLVEYRGLRARDVSVNAVYGGGRAVVAATAPSASYRDVTLRQVRAGVTHTPQRTAAQVSGLTAGGSAVAHLDLAPRGKQTAFQARVRARGVDLARIPASLLSAARDAGEPLPKERLRGKVNADVVARGALGQGAPGVQSATAQVNVDGARYGKWEADNARARLRLAGDVVTVESLTLRDEKGYAAIAGRVNTRRRTLDLTVEGDRIDLARLPLEQADPDRPRPTGMLYLRNGLLTGSFDDPRLLGTAFAYDLGVPKFRADYAVATIRANQNTIAIENGSAYRFPAGAFFSGTITQPLSESPRIELAGTFDDAELGEMVRLAGSDADVHGIVDGAFRVSGTLARPEVALPRVAIAGARIGDYDFQAITASARMTPDAEGRQTWLLDSFEALRERSGLPREQWTRVTASGRLGSDQRFRVDAVAARLDLTLLDPYLSQYVTVRGESDLSAVLTGRLVEGKAEDLGGEVTVATRSLTVNEVALGDVRGATPGQPARFTLSGDRVTSNDFVIGSQTSGVFLTPQPPAGPPAFLFDRSTDQLRAVGALEGIPIERLRQALANSPFLAANPDSPVARFARPVTRPLEGTINGRFTVGGMSREPVTTFAWNTRDARVQGFPIQRFEGSLNFGQGRLELTNVLLQSDEAIFTAAATVTDQGAVRASVDSANLPLSLVNRWVPGRAFLRDLTGTLENFHADVSGTTENPAVQVSLLATDVYWIETRFPTVPVPPSVTLTGAPAAAAPAARARAPRLVTRLNTAGQEIQVPVTGREVWVTRLDTSTITINGPANRNKIVADNVNLILRQPDPPPPGPNEPATALKEPRRFRLYASGQMDFRWSDLERAGQPQPRPRPGDPDPLRDPFIVAEVRVPQQDLLDLVAVMPLRGVTPPTTQDVNGTIRARLAWRGRPSAPEIRGEVVARADTLRLPDRATQVRDLTADLLFTGDAMEVRQLTAFTETIDPRTRKPVRSPEPIRVTGSLAVNPGGNAAPSVGLFPPRVGAALNISVGHLRYAVAELPGLEAGRFVTEDTSLALTVSGTLFKPHIAGTVTVAHADVQLPTGAAEGGPGALPPIQPSFGIDFVLGERVRIASSPLLATVHTIPGEPIELRGDVHGGDLRRMRLNGTLEVTGGTLSFPTARFALTRGGTVTLRYPFNVLTRLTEPSLGILVDVSATTRLTASPANNPNIRKRYTITVEAEGPINSAAGVNITDSFGARAGTTLSGQSALRLTFRSDPPDLAQDQASLQRRVTGLLGGERSINSLFSSRPDLGQIVRQQVTDILSASILPGLLDQVFGGLGGFEEFAVEIDQLNLFTLRITRRLFGPIYISYQRRISGNAGAMAGTVYDQAWRLELSYRFRPGLQFTYSTNDQRTNEVLLEGVFRF